MSSDESGRTNPEDAVSADLPRASSRFSMRAEYNETGTSLSLWLAGEIDAAERDVIIAQLDAGAPPTEISIEMSEVTFMGSAGLSALIHACRQLEAWDHKVVLASPSPQVIRLLDTCGLTHQFTLQLT